MKDKGPGAGASEVKVHTRMDVVLFDPLFCFFCELGGLTPKFLMAFSFLVKLPVSLCQSCSQHAAIGVRTRAYTGRQESEAS